MITSLIMKEDGCCFYACLESVLRDFNYPDMKQEEMIKICGLKTNGNHLHAIEAYNKLLNKLEEKNIESRKNDGLRTEEVFGLYPGSEIIIILIKQAPGCMKPENWYNHAIRIQRFDTQRALVMDPSKEKPMFPPEMRTRDDFVLCPFDMIDGMRKQESGYLSEFFVFWRSFYI